MINININADLNEICADKEVAMHLINVAVPTAAFVVIGVYVINAYRDIKINENNNKKNKIAAPGMYIGDDDFENDDGRDLLGDGR